MKLRKLITMREALGSPAYFGGQLSGDTWRNWRILLIAIVGEELTRAERVAFKALTGRGREPREAVSEFWAVIGRRGGKSRAMAVLAAYLAACVDHRHALAPGERGVIPILAMSTEQARSSFDFVEGVLLASPHLYELVEAVTSDTIALKTRVSIEVRPASFRTIRGITAVAAICDEIAVWRSDDSANPDREILKALRPALLTTGGMLACISSPHAKRGELYKTFRKHYGPDGRSSILVAHAGSRVMNSGLDQAEIDRAREEDPEAASAEYDAQFRDDVAVFVSREIVDQATSRGVAVRAPVAGVRYVAGVDPSGGSSDSMTMAIAHAHGDRLVLDLIAERRAPFSPESVVAEFAASLRQYRISKVKGDRYAGEWPREAFERHGVTYGPAELSKSDAYLAFLPLLNSGRADLVDHPRLLAQLCALERRTARGGQDSVDHPPNAHDDVANAVALAMVEVSHGKAPMVIHPAVLERSRRESSMRRLCLIAGPNWPVENT